MGRACRSSPTGWVVSTCSRFAADGSDREHLVLELERGRLHVQPTGHKTAGGCSITPRSQLGHVRPAARAQAPSRKPFSRPRPPSGTGSSRRTRGGLPTRRTSRVCQRSTCDGLPAAGASACRPRRGAAALARGRQGALLSCSRRDVDGSGRAQECRRHRIRSASSPSSTRASRPGISIGAISTFVTRDGQRVLVNLSEEDENAAPITVVVNWDANRQQP